MFSQEVEVRLYTIICCICTGELGADALPIITFVSRTRQTDDRLSVSYCVIKKNK